MKLSADRYERLAAIANLHKIRMVLLFGSAVTNRLHPNSDLDIGILVNETNVGLAELSKIHHELQDIFPEEELDLSLVNRADPLFLKKITEKCHLLYGEPSELHRLKIYAFRRYQDHRRFLEMERRYVERFIRKVNATP
jgi:predicted nucleotidyltransferase